MRTIGIDIGSYSIKVAEVEGQLKSVSVRNFFEIALTHEPGQDTRLEKVEALRRIVEQYDPRTYKYIVGLGSEYSTERILTFPFLERRKILQSLPFELEDTIPFSQSDAIFDFRLIKQRETTSQVLAIAAPKKYIQELLTLCEDAGLDPDIVSLEGVALSNLFEGEQVAETETQAGQGKPAKLVVHVGYSRTVIDVISEGRLLWSRALLFGGKDITYAVSRIYQLPYLEALKGVAERGFVLTRTDGADPDQIAFSRVISAALGQLVLDLKRTIIDLRSDLEVNINQGVIMGGMSGLLNLAPYLSQEIEIPFSLYAGLGDTFRMDVAKTPETEKAGPIAIGLALEGLRKPKSPALNLRRNDFSKESQRFKFMVEQYKDVAKVAAALFFCFVVYSWLRASFTEDNMSAVDQALKSQAKNPVLSLAPSQLKPETLKKFLKAKKEEIESKREVIRLSKTTSALDVLRTISDTIPPKNQVTLDLRRFDLDGENIAIEGFANSKSEADIIQRNLGLIPIISKLTSRASSLQPPAGKVAFSFTMHVARVPPSEKKGK